MSFYNVQMPNQAPVSRNNVVFKESNTEKLGVSLDMVNISLHIIQLAKIQFHS